ncbi:substrate-binding domain-containing protein [Maribellus mangrovi]|uniref:substrate-binding domain-containing protein n=1 Tax=Maribellus mangrovi TaxID=3133146 RepID=UPI0030EDB397
MKTRIIFIMVLLLLGFGGWSNKNAVPPAKEKETVKVCVTPAMGDLAESWISSYNQTNPDQKLELKRISPADVKTEITGDHAVGFVMQRPDAEMASKSMWHLTLGREVVVAVTNSANPFIEMLKTDGISSEELARIIKKNGNTWNDVLANGSKNTARIVVQDGPELGMAVSKFLKVDPAIVDAHVTTNEKFFKTIRKDAYAIGFCRLATITDSENHEFIANIQPLSFDRNRNEHIDYVESVHGKLDQLVRTVWIGKYPRELVYNLYAIAPEAPTNGAVLSFLSWVVTSGQTAVVENGYTDLAYYEKQSHLEKLNPPVLLAAETSTKKSNLATILLIAVVLLVVTAVLLWAWNSKRKTKQLLYDDNEMHKVLRPETIDIPNGLYFDKSHTWAFMEKDGTVKIGVDDFLQHVTGNYTGLVTKNPYEEVRRNEVVATLVHEGKKINIYAPVSGKIIQTNEDLTDYPSLVNNSPYSWGWIYQIQPTNWMREIRFLQMADKYRGWIKKEFVRLKDFITGVCQQKELVGQLVLQEGGELPDNVLHDFDPSVWEEFQIRFIDNSDIN